MALKAMVESLEGLPEAVAKEYKKVTDDTGTRYILDTEGVEDVAGLKSALGKERKNRATLEKAVKKLGLKPDDEPALNALVESLGDDTLEEALAKAKASAATADEGSKAVAALKKVQKLVDEREEALKAANAFIDRLVRENAIKDVLAMEEHEGNVVLLMPHLLTQTMTVEEDGANGKEFVAKVVDPKSKEVRMKGAKEMTLVELVVEMKAKPEFTDAFTGTGASGSGAISQRRVDPAGGGSGNRKPGDAVAAKKQSGSYNAV